jgi:hypothetical protein
MISLTLQQAHRPHYLYAAIKNYGEEHVKSLAWQLASELDERGENIVGRRVRESFWEAKKKADKEMRGQRYEPRLPPPIPVHLLPVVKSERKEPEPTPTVTAKKTKELSEFGEWLDRHRRVSVHKMSKNFGFGAGNISQVRYKNKRFQRLTPKVLKNVIRALAHYGDATQHDLARELAAATPEWNAICREAFPDAFSEALLYVYKDDVIIESIPLPIGSYELLNKLTDLAIEHGYNLSISGE